MRDGHIQRAELGCGLLTLREIRRDFHVGGWRGHGRVRAMGVLEVDLEIEPPLAGVGGQELLYRRGDRLSVSRAVHVLKAETFRMQRNVLTTEEMGLEAGASEHRRRMRGTRCKLPVEAVMREPH